MLCPASPSRRSPAQLADTPATSAPPPPPPPCSPIPLAPPPPPWTSTSTCHLRFRHLRSFVCGLVNQDADHHLIGPIGPGQTPPQLFRFSMTLVANRLK